MINKPVKFPAPLKPGDTIAICSPAGPIDPAPVYKARDVLAAQGWNVVIMPHTLGRSGNYSGTDAERFDDLRAALLDPSVKAIVCSRGGYGVVHLMEALSALPIADNPKWVVGFSDISALHAMMLTKGVASVHASMAKHIALGPDDEDNDRLFSILRGERRVFTFPSDSYDRQGLATGVLAGGNLAVLAELIDTPYNIIEPDTVLFVEDVAEPIYKIERIFYQLRLSGVLGRLAGLMVGQFTEYKADASYSRMEDMIRTMTAGYDYPVAFNVPVGHVDHNVPLIEGAKVTLKVTDTGQNHLIYWL